MEEIWRDIKDYEGLYKISNLGNVYSYRKNRNLKPYLWSGYPNVNLVKNKKRKGMQIHRLVAKAFIPNPNNYKIVNHKDYNRTNNNVNNLEWCTQKENINWSINNMIGKNHIKNKKTYGICYRNRKGGYYEVTIKQKYYGQYKKYKDAKKKRDEILNELNITI